MRKEEREALRQRFRFRCGYCGVREQDVGAELTVDHFQPRSKGGVDESENWVYCCHACNEFKGDFWQPNAIERILHPLRDDMATHITEREDGTLLALTETGRFHIEVLHLNRQNLVSRRYEQRLEAIGRRRLRRLIDRLRESDAKVQSLTAQLEKLKGNDPKS